MNARAKKPEDVTWAEIRATFAEAAALAKTNEKSLYDLDIKLDRMVEERILETETRKLEAEEREKQREIAAKQREIATKEREKQRELATKEREKQRELAAKEREIAEKKREKSLDRLEETVDKMAKAVSDTTRELKGIAKSNGMVAEEYFYRTLDESLTFGEYHFDFADRNLKRKNKNKDGKPVETEYDILMVNKVAACIFEVKYRARKDHIDDLLEKVGKFRIQFPDYANRQVFLGIGALSFDPGVENAAKAHGIGIMKQNGDAVEIYDKDLKVY